MGAGEVVGVMMGMGTSYLIDASPFSVLCKMWSALENLRRGMSMWEV